MAGEISTHAPIVYVCLYLFLSLLLLICMFIRYALLIIFISYFIIGFYIELNVLRMRLSSGFLFPPLISSLVKYFSPV